MYIQIDNIGFNNKGAELMLRAIIERLEKEKSLNPKFVLGLNGHGTPKQIMQAGLYQTPNLQRYRVKWQNHFSQKRLDPYGLAKHESINVLLDAGGFQFGDQWVYSYSKTSNQNLRKYYQSYKKTGSKIVLLPQAFGPFKNNLSIERMKIVYDYADLIYAREEISFDHLKNLFIDNKKIRLAPDFTSLLIPEISLNLFNRIRGGVCLIPNARMIDKTSPELANSYFTFLLKTSESIISKGLKLILLNHEGQGDWQLICRIIDELKENAGDIIPLTNLNALEAKAIIGNCQFVISSRFHGVVSGLNQSIPTLCTSWSHKYEELLKIYGVPNNLLDPIKLEESILKIENALTNPTSYAPSIDTINKNKSESEIMWTHIIKNIINPKNELSHLS